MIWLEVEMIFRFVSFGRQEKFSNSRRSRMTTFISLFSFCYSKKWGGGGDPSPTWLPRCRRPYLLDHTRLAQVPTKHSSRRLGCSMSTPLKKITIYNHFWKDKTQNYLSTVKTKLLYRNLTIFYNMFPICS